MRTLRNGCFILFVALVAVGTLAGLMYAVVAQPILRALGVL